ncbi:Spb1 C-terminal domain-containing protein [Pavlovales sp. CCMP2436]|nr:Spb1 C-terminal domain-containing protein [Pavlovales sp. CCMP2436]
MDDERKVTRSGVALVDAESLNAAADALQAVDARSIGKVVEAKARKKRRMAKMIEKLKKTAEVIVDKGDMSEREKGQAIEKLYKGKLKNSQKRPSAKLVVTGKGGKAGVAKATKGAKSAGNGKIKNVDKRMLKVRVCVCAVRVCVRARACAVCVLCLSAFASLDISCLISVFFSCYPSRHHPLRIRTVHACESSPRAPLPPKGVRAGNAGFPLFRPCLQISDAVIEGYLITIKDVYFIGCLKLIILRKPSITASEICKYGQKKGSLSCQPLHPCPAPRPASSACFPLLYPLPSSITDTNPSSLRNQPHFPSQPTTLLPLATNPDSNCRTSAAKSGLRLRARAPAAAAARTARVAERASARASTATGPARARAREALARDGGDQAVF